MPKISVAFKPKTLNYIYIVNVKLNIVNELPITSVYSADPIRPNSSAPQLPKIIDLRGLHVPSESNRS